MSPIRFDPDDYPDRGSLIRDLYFRGRLPAGRIGGFFGMTDRQVRRIAEAGPVAPKRPRGRPPTLDEVRAMLDDYHRDPAIGPADREAARA